VEITYWHRLAQLFLNHDLSLPEIGKTMIINSAIGLIEVNKGAPKVGVNVLDNSAFNEALVIGLLQKLAPDKAITFMEIGQLLNVNHRVAGYTITRLLKKEIISKRDYGTAGVFYTINADKKPALPPWVKDFTAALIDLHSDADFRARVIAECEEISFRRGFEVLKDEMREKFNRRREGI
jgi:hypothetical protein